MTRGRKPKHLRDEDYAAPLDLNDGDIDALRHYEGVELEALQEAQADRREQRDE